MSTLTIDTHKAVTLLTQHGYSADQAEGMVAVFKEAELIDGATKSDIQAVLDAVSQSRSDVQGLRSEMYKVVAAQTLIIIAAVVGILQLVL